MTSEETSRSLLALVQSSDPEGWQRLTDLYAPLIAHWCRRLELPEQEIADVTQEVLQAVVGNIQRFRRERPQDTFRGWLRVITRNKVMDAYRRGQHQQKPTGGTTAMRKLAEVPTPPIAESDEDQEEARLYHDVVLRALESVRPHFKEQTWQAFWGVAVAGRPANDVADELAMKPGTVRVAKSRVLQRLRQELGEQFE